MITETKPRRPAHPGSVAIVCGTLLVIAPLFHDAYVKGLITRMVIAFPEGTKTLNGPLPPWYLLGCWAIGVLLLLAGLYLVLSPGLPFRGSPPDRGEIRR